MGGLGGVGGRQRGGADPLCPLCVRPLHQRIGAIALGDILAAEKVEEKSFGSSHVMQVVYLATGGQQETAYLQCKVRRGHSARWHSPGGGTARAPSDCPQPRSVSTS